MKLLVILYGIALFVGKIYLIAYIAKSVFT